jgi:hypothetical protein
MIESLTDFHALRSNPQVMIKGKAAPYFASKREEEAPKASIMSDRRAGERPLSDEETRVLKELKLRDTAVREEEESHARMLGRHAGAIRYEYQIGPDGRAYVTNGSVEVSPKFISSEPDDIRKVLQTIQRAAVSVSNPSQADLNIAASASAKAAVVSQKQAISKYMHGIEAQSTSTEALVGPTISSQLNTVA